MKPLSTIALAVALGVPLSGSTIISSYPQAPNGGFTLNGNPLSTDAAGFTMGSTAFHLNSITVTFGAVGISSFASGLVFADLYGGTAGGAGVPTGGPLVSLSTPAATITNGSNLTYTPANAFDLQASTTYWIVLHPDPLVDKDLSWATAVNPASGVFAALEGAAVGSGLPPATHNANDNFMFQVDGTAIVASGTPEPASWVLYGSGLAAVWFARRRHAAQRNAC